MSAFGFQTLTLIAVVGMTGPLLASLRRFGIPVIIGELVAGLVVGRTGFGLVDHADATFTLLANIGFALVMFVVGTHVPARDETLRSQIPRALLRAVAVGAVAALLGVVLARVFGTGHAAVYAVLMASSSAALALPVIDSLRLTGPPVLSVTTQIAIADAASIVLLPLVINPAQTARAALGALAIACCAAVLFVVLRMANRRGWRRQLHHWSHKRRLALELRLSLILLFGLCALAMTSRVSIMLAGFALGLVVSAVGTPRRLARQLFGITEGFFSPLFFVWLGASLQVRELGEHPWLILLGLSLGAGALIAHAVGVLFGQPVTLAVLSAAQLGVPVAAATLGTEQHLLGPGEPSALMLGALVTVAATSLAGAVAAHRQHADESKAAPQLERPE
ncbi:cation:proton antiporter [Mycobacterium sp. 3519A]|uniref:cation:proton antiporter n=1 Tax=Mycobacterium sp. 3519A TaxID=2057184 RepID=UPI000C7DBFCB|nr:cation:proton antiporter [Mycobacterium sp. 3519A]